jgi:SAM-dependent methyltransferase
MKGRDSGMPDERYWGSFFNPRCILERLDCSERCRDAVEFGCGYGTFTLPAAELISGRIFALDIEPAMLDETRQRTMSRANVVPILRDIIADGTGLPDDSVDFAMLFNILHVENPVELLHEARRVLSPEGRAAIIHWRTDIPTPRGPALEIRPTAEQCRVWGEAAGLEFVRTEELCCCSWHWGLVMKRP